MKRFLLMLLVLSCLTAIFCPAFAAVECTVPKELSGGTEAPDVPMLGGAPEETAPADNGGQGTAAEDTDPGLPLIPAAVLIAAVILTIKLLVRRTSTTGENGHRPKP